MVRKSPAKWNFIDKLIKSWSFTNIGRAKTGTLELNGLPLPQKLEADVCFEQFYNNWESELQAEAEGQKPSLMRCLRKTYGRDIFIAGIFKAIWSFLVIFAAYYFVKEILQFVDDTKKDPSMAPTKGFILSIFFFVDSWLLGLALQQMGWLCMNVGIQVRSALTAMICKKSFSMAHITKDLTADAVSFVASDVSKVFDGIQDIHYIWTSPFEAAAILLLLWTKVGIWVLPGVAVICVIVPMQYVFGYLIIVYKKKNSPHARDRNIIVKEILPAMKLVKFYAWESYFEKLIGEVRAREMKNYVKVAIVKIVNVAMVFGTPPLVASAVFISYQYGQGRITARMSFVLLSLCNILRFPLVVLPKAMRAFNEALTAIERIEEFLLTESITKDEEDRAHTQGIHIRQGQFMHETNESFVLNVPEFHVRKGEIVAVCGRVGAGKSSLIHAILGDMEKLAGEVHVGGQIAYVPQNPWVQNLPLKENVTFGEPYDEEKYNDTIDACSLRFDLGILPKGDMSLCGLRGINLSGGQRQRVNVARACYCPSDVILLDNALSAVDHHTAHDMFRECLRGRMGDKAVVFVTHQVEFLPQCNNVAIMNEGDMVYFGPWNENAKRLLNEYLPVSHLLAAAGGAEQPKPKDKKKAAAPVRRKSSRKDLKKEKEEAKKNADSETSYTMTQAMKVYTKNGLMVVFFLSLFFFLAAQTDRQIADWWIRMWVSGEYNGYQRQGFFSGNNFYCIIFAGLTFMFITLMLFRGWMFFAWSLGSSNRMFGKMTHRVLYAPLYFFLTTPVGNLLVNFSRDQDIHDESLPDALHYAGIYGLILLATTITVSTQIELFSVMSVGLFIVTGLMLFAYLPTATQLKHLRNETAGQLVTLVAEALEGLTVIQAFDKQGYFIEEADLRTDNHHRALFNGESLNLWLAFFCDFYGSVLVLSVSMFAVAQRQQLGAAKVGLAFSNTIQMLVFYTWSVRLLADTVSLFSATEDIGWLAEETPQEGAALIAGATDAPGGNGKGGASLGPPGREDSAKRLTLSGKRSSFTSKGPPSKWPSQGVVKFDNVWMKYAPKAPYALREVSFTIQGAEKVGVVGRTGSGKSTLLLALYRMFNLDLGRILIDNVDIASLTLLKLRRSLSIIPQEPLVFSGSMRSNLDPYTEHSDMELWHVIKEANLMAMVAAIGGLDGLVDGSGSSSISLGQAQLVCLCRAALRKVPILCLDEATAAMDPVTETEVQDTIHRIFSDRTMFIIAHRLDTVIETDKIIVMEAGNLAEMDSPAALLDNKASMFSKLVDASGPVGAANLRATAAECFARKMGHKLPVLERLSESRPAAPGSASLPNLASVNEDLSPLKREDSMESVHSRRGRSRSRQRLDQLASVSKDRFVGMIDNVAGQLGYTRAAAPPSDDSAKDSDSTST